MMEIQVDDRQVTARLDAAKTGVFPAITSALAKIGGSLHRAVVDKMGEDGILGVRTGTLKRAVFDRVDVTGPTTAELHVGVDLAKAPYGRVQELGGTIRPTTADHLTIPLSAALTPNGVARFTARDVIANPFAFGFSGTFVAKDIIFGTLGLGGKNGKNGKKGIVPLFALKTSVTLEARNYLKSTYDGQRETIIGTLKAAVEGGLRGR